MQYILLIYGDEAAGAKATEAEQAIEYQEYNAYSAALRDSGAYVSGEALHPTTAATTVRVRDGKPLTTDGPFAETKEQLGGYYIVDAKDLDAAIEWAAKIPGARQGSIEIRPLMVFE
jgi:hypothetical protein